MNRLQHLQETLPRNMRENADYKNLEFVILDYNSSDGLYEWMMEKKANLGVNIKYLRTTSPKHYHRSHSRNMAFRNATGDILCNIDADNFAGKGFASYLNDTFTANSGIFVSPSSRSMSDVFGKICVRSEDFHAVRGYDERIDSYGFEDNDLKLRLIKHGLDEVNFTNSEFFKAVSHSNDSRINNEYLTIETEKVFIKKVSHRLAEIFFQLKNKNFEYAQVEDSAYGEIDDFNFSIIEVFQPKDRYKVNISSTLTEKEAMSLMNGDAVEMVEKKEVLQLIYFYSQLKNKKVFLENELNFQRPKFINPQGYGLGEVVTV